MNVNMRDSNTITNFSMTATVNISASVIGLLTGIFLARLLGPEERGALAAIQNIPTLLLGVGSLGITTAVAYYSGKDPKSAGTFLVTGLITLILWSIPLMVLSYHIIPYFIKGQSPIIIKYARLYLLIIPIQFFIGVPFWVLQGVSEFRLWNILRFQAPVAWALSILAMWIYGTISGEYISIVYLAIMSIVACVFMVVTFKIIPAPYKFNIYLLPKLLYYGLPTSLTVVPQQLNLRLDQLLMAAMLSAESLGLYVVAVAWSGGTAPIFTSVSQILFPRLASIQDKEIQAEILQQVIRMSSLCSIVVTVILIILTPIVFPWLFGRLFIEAVSPAAVLVLASGISNLNNIASDGLRGLGFPKWPLIAEFIGLGVTMLSLSLLLLRYKLMGAAISSLVSYLVTFIILILSIVKETKTSIYGIIVPRREDVYYLTDKLSLHFLSKKL